MVLPDRTIISLPVLRKLKELVQAGATVIGPKPAEASTLAGLPAMRYRGQTDCRRHLGPAAEATGEQRYGQGRVIWGKNAREILLADGVRPDFEVTGAKPDAVIDYIHRTDGDIDIYFVANRNNRGETVRCTFRIAGKAPELWDPVSGAASLCRRLRLRPTAARPCRWSFPTVRLGLCRVSRTGG